MHTSCSTLERKSNVTEEQLHYKLTPSNLKSPKMQENQRENNYSDYDITQGRNSNEEQFERNKLATLLQFK